MLKIEDDNGKIERSHTHTHTQAHRVPPQCCLLTPSRKLIRIVSSRALLVSFTSTMHLSPTLRPSSSYHRHHRHHHPRPQHLLLVALLNIGFLATTAAAFTAKPSAAVEDTEEDLSAVPEWVYLLEAYGIDLTAMLLIAWTVLVAMLVLGVVLWNKLTQSHQPPKQDNRRNNEAKVSKESAVDNMSSLPPSAALKSSSAQPPLTSSTDSASIVGKDRDTIAWLQRVIEWMGKLSTSSGHTTTTTTTNDIIDTWLAALNAKSKKLTLENGITLEFSHVKQNESTPPKWHNVRIDDQFNEHMNVSCRVTCDRLVLQVRVTSNNDNSSGSSSSAALVSNGRAGSASAATTTTNNNNNALIYDIVLEKLTAPVKVVIVREESLFIVRLLDRPDVKVQIVPVTSVPTLEKTITPELVINGTINGIFSTVTDFKLGSSDLPHYRCSADYTNNTNTNNNHKEIAEPQQHKQLASERKLLVKIIKANNLNVTDTATGQHHQIYCTIEVDEPTRSSKTSNVRESPTSAEWEQHFLFNINQRSSEILFEVFDGSQLDENGNRHDKFLGLGIFSVAELKLNPSQKISIPLQARPLEKTVVTGSLDVELLLMEHKNSFITDTDEPLSSNQISALFSKSEFDLVDDTSEKSLSLSLAFTTSTTTTTTTTANEDLHCLQSDDTLADCSELSLDDDDDSLGDYYSIEHCQQQQAPPLVDSWTTTTSPSSASVTSSAIVHSVPATADHDNKAKVLNCSIIDRPPPPPCAQSPTMSAPSSRPPPPPPLSSSPAPSTKKANKFLYSFTSFFTSSVGPPKTYRARQSKSVNQHHRKYSEKGGTKKKLSSPTLSMPSDNYELSISMPTISPLIGANHTEAVNGQTTTNVDDKGQEVEKCAGTANRLGWLRTRSGRDRSRGAGRQATTSNDKEVSKTNENNNNNNNANGKFVLPPTVLYPALSSEQQRQQQQQQQPPPPSSQPPNHCLTLPAHSSFMLARPLLSADHKRQSIYSQLSLESINSHLEVNDDSAIDPVTGTAAVDVHPIRRMETLERNSRRLAPINLTDSFRSGTSASMYDRRTSKAKSDSHLIFSLEFENYEDAVKGNAAFLEALQEGEDEREEEDEEEEDDGIEKDRRTTTPDSSGSSIGHKKSLRRRLSNRRSLYAKFRGAGRRKTSPATNEEDDISATAKSVKQKFKFRYSSKVPKRVEQAKLSPMVMSKCSPILSTKHQQQTSPDHHHHHQHHRHVHQPNGSVLTVDSVFSSSASSSPSMSNYRNLGTSSPHHNNGTKDDDLSITSTTSTLPEKQVHQVHNRTLHCKSLTNLNFFRVDNEVDVVVDRQHPVHTKRNSMQSPPPPMPPSPPPPPPLPPRGVSARPKPALPPYPRHSQSTGRLPLLPACHLIPLSPTNNIVPTCAPASPASPHNTSAGNYIDSSSFATFESDLTQLEQQDAGYNKPRHTSLSATLPANAERPKKEKGVSLMRAIRKRLSFSGKRSKSVERRPTSREGSVLSDLEHARSVPGSREPSMVKESLHNGESRRHKESFGNLSESSAKTFLHEDSVLVIECGQGENMRHFVVSDPKRNKSKWRRKGIKLHLYNEHLFVARHMSTSTTCQVCSKAFPRRLGKQGYQCRDCGIFAHKRCHVLVEMHCPSSSLVNMNLEPIDAEGGVARDDRRSLSPTPQLAMHTASSPMLLPEVHVIGSDDIDDRIA